MLSPNKTLVDENNLEIKLNSVIHCLGSLFQVTDTGLRHIVGKKIDDDTYFADSNLYIQLNELAFVEQLDVAITPDAAPKKEGLLTSAYRFMTAPFLVRTPSNVMTHNKQKKFSPDKLVRIDNSATSNITSEAENTLKVPTSQEIIGLNSRCEKAIMNEVKFFIHSYEEFMTCKNKKLQCVIDALNAANTERYNEVKIQYPGFTWDPPLIDIGTLVQRAYPAEVVEYTPERGKKLDLDSENTVRNKVEEPAGQADSIMREETKQHEGTLTWELFQSTLIEHFYHIPSKERAASLLSKLQQDPHENIGEYVQRGSEITQVHSGKTNLKEIAASQYGWNLVQGLTNISIKNKIADRISHCQSLSDVCKLVKQVKREMENRESFTGISVETEESMEEINWRQHNPRGRGNNRDNYRGNYHQTSYNT